MKTIRYFFLPKSPWAYLGHERLLEIARRHDAQIELRPIDLGGGVFPVSGGLPMSKRAPQRLAYRLIELERWSEYLGLPINKQPKFFPVDDQIGSRMIIAAMESGDRAKAFQLAGGLLRAVWAEERNIADTSTLERIANESGLNGKVLLEAQSQAQVVEAYARYTQEAIDLQVFGAPWYEYRGMQFWGQDRLDFLDRALTED
ncbi:2-hydroxychromene-2-carboxylate isomerase [Alcaligenaceae bacterium]|nr:2-hydroxychromene-2-carboxylate isomerase [Alcaligenaceae bacterium]